MEKVKRWHIWLAYKGFIVDFVHLSVCGMFYDIIFIVVVLCHKFYNNTIDKFW